MRALVTGSAGLIGSEAVKFLIAKGFDVFGIDNDMRSYFFGKDASTNWKKQELEKAYPKNYWHYNIDIRDKEHIKKLFREAMFNLIIHTAAQPSHDWAAKEPFTDFEINANGTLNLLENYRQYCPNAVFIFTSTNKVYGDSPNKVKYIENELRYELDDDQYGTYGFDETLTIDNSKHSLFGASKVAADILVQEYGKYFGLNTGVFRGGCLTGPAHSAAELHGFLGYLVKCIKMEKKYTIFGYKGKQVRDNIHSFDLVNAFWHFYQKPRPGEVYNMGGSRFSNISMLEAIYKIENLVGKKAIIEYKEENRSGDHIWYISDVRKFMSHFPMWRYEYDIDKILIEMAEGIRV